mmetsp:Transcript_121981/g.340071  ORF Transcript_121981/g.340071 Transcript_121981/m.340071 type:complete len:237 (+) Transcript_121981:88-798(+)
MNRPPPTQRPILSCEVGSFCHIAASLGSSWSMRSKSWNLSIACISCRARRCSKIWVRNMAWLWYFSKSRSSFSTLSPRLCIWARRLRKLSCSSSNRRWIISARSVNRFLKSCVHFFATSSACKASSWTMPVSLLTKSTKYGARMSTLDVVSSCFSSSAPSRSASTRALSRAKSYTDGSRTSSRLPGTVRSRFLPACTDRNAGILFSSLRRWLSSMCVFWWDSVKPSRQLACICNSF